MIILRALALCAVAVAAACAPSRDQISIQHHNQCESFGFSYGNADYANCRMQLNAMQQQHRAAERRAGDAMMMQGLGLLYDSSRPQGYPVRTYTSPSGRVVTCTETPYSTNCI